MNIPVEIVQQIPENHFFSREAICSFLNSYNEEDMEKIVSDFHLLQQQTFANADRKKIYLFTAGGPGAGKSTILENELDKREIHYAYIDPDRRGLQKMESTYLTDIKSGATSEEAYTKWRGASNFIANTLMAIALDQGYAIAHGTTMTSPHAANALQAIKNYGYERHLLHITSPDVVRIASDRARQEVLFQCTEEDLIKKGKAFFERYDDYLANTDKISFYYRPAVDETVLAATQVGEELTVRDEASWAAIRELHQNKGALAPAQD
ncbi:MAG: hypothetical protein ChlgKO_00740 [Chlamydiales bacterium]